MRNVSYLWWIGILFAAIALILCSFYWDDAFRNWLISVRPTDWRHTSGFTIAKFLSKYGDWPELLALGAASALIAWKAGSPAWTRIFVAAMIAAILAGSLATTCRSLTGRTRPDASTKPGWYGPYHNGRILIGIHSYNSFPSGHTATAVSLAAVILFSQPFWGIPCMLVALSIAGSRLYLDKHHLSDVAVSLILGLLIGWIVHRILKEKGDTISAWITNRLSK